MSKVVCGYSCYFYIGIYIDVYIFSNTLLTFNQDENWRYYVNAILYPFSKLIITKWVHV